MSHEDLARFALKTICDDLGVKYAIVANEPE